MKTNMKTNLKTNMKTSVKMLLAGTAATLLAAAPAIAAPASPAKSDAHVGQMLVAQNLRGSCTVIAHLTGDLTPARQASLTEIHADITRHLGFIQSVALTLPTRNLNKLAALPFVTHLSYDGTVKKLDAFTVGSSGAGVAFQQYGLTGQGVGVAVLDSGIRTDYLDLAYPTTTETRVIVGPHYAPATSKIYTPDMCGHGTHIAGIIAGNGRMSTGPQFTQTVCGIARQSTLIDVAVLDPTGAASVSTVLTGLKWVIANKTKDNIRVVNLSLGHPVGESYTTDPLCQAVEAVWKAGIVVVCAAGNNGRASLTNTTGASNEGWGTAYGSIQSPGNDPYVITVGATKNMDGVRADDRIATYSSRGPSRLDLVLKPDIIAPGNQIVSLCAGGDLFGTAAGQASIVPEQVLSPTASSSQLSNYAILSGTSMAAPVVSGAAALMLQANPKLTPDTIKARLMASADKWTDPSGNPDPCTYGAGYLNIPAALASTVTPTQYALSPTMIQLGGSLFIDTSAIGSASVWGSKTLTGVNTLYGSKTLTGVNTLYGSKTLTGVNTIYSSKTLSGVSSIYGSSVWSDMTVSGSSASAAVDLSSIALQGE